MIEFALVCALASPASEPVVVALVLCRFEELERARRHRPRAEAFIDRVFFADDAPPDA